MSDFFASLVARSFGTAQVIRPRLTSLFEPMGGDATSIGNTSASGAGEPTYHPENEVDAESPQERDPEPRFVRSPKNDEHRTVADDSPAASNVSRSTAREPQRAMVAEKVLAGDEEAQSASKRSTGQVAAERMVVAPAIRQEPDTRLVRDRSTPPVIASVSPARQMAATEDGRGLLIPPKLTPRVQLSDPDLGVRPDRQSRQKKRDPLSDASRPPEPIIQVTIGRIEVRGTKESGHPPRTPPASPVMSLDEYLRGRARRAGP
jgi:hypothetical protein